MATNDAVGTGGIQAGLPASNSLEQQVERFRQELAGFFGTEQWTRMPTLCKHFVLLTDGALYVAEHGGENGQSAYWLIDAIASYQGEPAFRRQDFQVWTLRVLPADPPEIATNPVETRGNARPGTDRPQFHPHRHAVLTCQDGNNSELARQEIEYTDFLPVGEIQLYASVEEHPDISLHRQVMILLLPSEY